MNATPEADLSALAELATVLNDAIRFQRDHLRHRNQTQFQLLTQQMEKQMPHNPKPRQFDLFASPQKGEGACPPPWESLPAQTRQQLKTLMARLILNHDADARADKETARDDV